MARRSTGYDRCHCKVIPRSASGASSEPLAAGQNFALGSAQRSFGARRAAMAQKKLIIEMRLNEYEMRDRNRNVPWTADELARDAAACREAGASIVHFHARTADGAPAFDYESYRDVIQAIRASCDVLIHPTLGGPAHNASASDRLAHVVRLAESNVRPDFVPMDMGTSNVDIFDEAAGRFV